MKPAGLCVRSARALQRVGQEYGRAMARTNLLQPARASLVEEWVGYVHSQFPERAEGMDVAAFADGHLKGYSVVAEIFANMDEARRLAYSAWDEILTLGRCPVDAMYGVSRFEPLAANLSSQRQSNAIRA